MAGLDANFQYSIVAGGQFETARNTQVLAMGLDGFGTVAKNQIVPDLVVSLLHSLSIVKLSWGRRA
jgi:hypothetical protein